jgi:4-hydroxythreonine-4-phosphate dehydrogenase
MRPIAFTPGEPAGIGPDLAVQLSMRAVDQVIVAVADPQLLSERARRLNIPLDILTVKDRFPVTPANPGSLYVNPVQLSKTAVAGQLDVANADYVLETIRTSVRGCQSGDFAALVTGPIHKGIINDAGTSFTGHTEYLATLTASDPVMMLVCPGLRVALATTHLPLRQVSDAITEQVLTRVLHILHQDLTHRFGIEQPRILVCGLNPHAGEGGHLGYEEMEIISPLLERLRTTGMQLLGPLPADTLFTPRYLEQADAVLAMYHDQGLPVLKHKGFGKAVNITLGLPIIRTSVDHGTALDLAGTGKAEIGSLLAAIEQAAVMSSNIGY